MADLTAALRWSRAQDALPFVAETAVELTDTLGRRAGAGDHERAEALLAEAAAIAADLTMAPLAATYAGTSPDGLCVISVWESKAHADRFTAERLVPALQRLGVTRDQQTRRPVLEIELEDVSVQ